MLPLNALARLAKTFVTSMQQEMFDSPFYFLCFLQHTRELFHAAIPSSFARTKTNRDGDIIRHGSIIMSAVSRSLELSIYPILFLLPFVLYTRYYTTVYSYKCIDTSLQ